MGAAKPTLQLLSLHAVAKTVDVLSAQSCPVFMIPWTIAHQAPLSVGILQARTLE